MSANFIGQILNLLFIVALFAIPFFIIFQIAKFMKISNENQQKLMQKLEDIEKALREK